MGLLMLISTAFTSEEPADFFRCSSIPSFWQIFAHVCLQLFDEDALRGYLGLHLSVRAAGDAQPHRATAMMRVSGDSVTLMGVVVVVDVWLSTIVEKW